MTTKLMATLTTKDAFKWRNDWHKIFLKKPDDELMDADRRPRRVGYCLFILCTARQTDVFRTANCRPSQRTLAYNALFSAGEWRQS